MQSETKGGNAREQKTQNKHLQTLRKKDLRKKKATLGVSLCLVWEQMWVGLGLGRMNGDLFWFVYKNRNQYFSNFLRDFELFYFTQIDFCAPRRSGKLKKGSVLLISKPRDIKNAVIRRGTRVQNCRCNCFFFFFFSFTTWSTSTDLSFTRILLLEVSKSNTPTVSLVRSWRAWIIRCEVQEHREKSHPRFLFFSNIILPPSGFPTKKHNSFTGA